MEAKFDPSSSRRSKRSELLSVSFSPKIQKTLEVFSENKKLDKNPSDDKAAAPQKTSKRKRNIRQAKTKYTRQEQLEAGSTSNSLEFPSHTQDELKKIYGERTQRNIRLTFDPVESESSEEEEEITDEELEKTEGWKLFMEGLDSKFVKKH